MKISQLFKSLNPLLFSLLFLLVFINSCRKDSDTGPQIKDPYIAEAKTFFDTQIAPLPDKAVDHTLRHSADKKPLWAKAYTKPISLGQAVVVPLEYSSKISTEVGKNRDKVALEDISYLMLYKDRQGEFHAEVVTRIPDDDYWDKGKAAGKNFYGLVLVEDWWGKAIRTFRKTIQGTIMLLGNPGSLPKSERNKEKNKNKTEVSDFSDGSKCISVVVRNEVGMYEVEYICPPEPYPTETERDRNPDLEGREDFPHGGGGGSGRGHGNNGGRGSRRNPGEPETPTPDERDDNPPPRQDIINNLPEGCLKNVVNELIQKDCKNELSSMINQIFNASPELDIVIDGRSTFSNDIDGDASTQLGGNGYCRINIDLNTNILPGAAKEYIAATMFHESIHAYLSATDRMSDLDHQVIAETYISKMVAGIQELYPSISLQDAEALAWGGLQKTSAWAALQSSDPANANMIIQTNNNYRNGQVGNRCNPR